MSIWSREAAERQRSQDAYNNFVGERMRDSAAEEERRKDASRHRGMGRLIEQGLRHAVQTQPDLFPPFDFATAADIVVAYITGGR